MIFENIKSNLNAASIMRHPEECLLFGFNLPLAGFDYALTNLCEQGWTGGPVATLKQSQPYKVSMKKATLVIADPSTITGGILVMMKPEERVIVTWDGVAGHAIRYDLPLNSILIRNTSGYLVHGPSGGDPATCYKRLVMGKARYVLPAGTSGDSRTVQDFEAAGFLTRNLSISRTLLERRGFISRTGELSFRMAFIPCGRGSVSVQNVRPNTSTVTEAPVNTLSFSFSTPAAADCKLIAEYSGPDNQWKPLALVDTTRGFTQSGKIHFEPPSDWVETTRWDADHDIGGGPHGTGPRARWIRLQRRSNSSKITGAVTSAFAAQNLPYLVATREDNPIPLEFKQKQVGQTVTFRFVPISEDGKEQLASALLFNHRIAGKAFA
ncbi:MAG: hypothetical protein ACM359_12940 [Bacillota bacterium]